MDDDEKDLWENTTDAAFWDFADLNLMTEKEKEKFFAEIDAVVNASGKCERTYPLQPSTELASDSESSSSRDEFYDALSYQPWLGEAVAGKNQPHDISALDEALRKLTVEDCSPAGTSGSEAKKSLQKLGHNHNRTNSARTETRTATSNSAQWEHDQNAGAPRRKTLEVKAVSTDESERWIGTYKGGRQERKRLATLGYDVQGKWTNNEFTAKTDTAHLVDHVVAFPHPHLRDRASKEEKENAYNLGPAYNDESTVHRRHVGSYRDAQSNGFDRREHAWKTPAEYRNHARAALRDEAAMDSETGNPTRFSNAVQMYLLDTAHVQSFNTTESSPLGLYKHKSEIEAASNSFVRTITANPPIFYIKDTKAPAVRSLQNEQVESQHFARTEQAEVVLAQEILMKCRYPNQDTVEKAAKKFLSKAEYNEKQDLWERADSEKIGRPSYDDRSRDKNRGL